MTNSSEQSTPPSPHHRKLKRLALVLLGVAPLGFADASYLTAEHYLNRTPPCSIVHGCATVTTSRFAIMFGIPVALLGALYYLAVIFGLVYYLQSKNHNILRLTAAFTIAGFVFSLWFVYLQIFVIRAICAWCMFSALTSTTLFILGMWVIKSHRAYGKEAFPEKAG
jgi:uncharacterized membrane protein